MQNYSFPPEQSTLQQKIIKYKNYVAGGFAGIACVLIGQPFDTVKVRLQASTNKINMFDVINNLIQMEGYKGFYSGVASPLIAKTVIDSIKFGALSQIDTYLKSKNTGNQSEFQQILNYTIGGSFGAFLTSFITSPMEHIRIKMQLLSQNNSAPYRTTGQCFKYVVSQYGIKGLYKGLPLCMLRDTFGYFVYFGVYKTILTQAQKILQLNNNPQFLDNNDKYLLSLCHLACGSLAGTFLWLSIYPLDTIKSNIQGDCLQKPKYRGVMQVIQNHSFSQLWKGLTPCLLRAAPANAGVFFTYETTKTYIDNLAFNSVTLNF